MFEKAIEIDTQLLHVNHKLLASSHQQIATIHMAALSDPLKALYHAEKSLRILLHSQAKDNPVLLASYQQLIGFIQLQLGDTTMALKMAEKALNNILKCASENQDSLAKQAVEQAKLWGMRNRTFQLEHFLSRLEEVKNEMFKDKSSQISVSTISAKLIRERRNFPYQSNISKKLIPRTMNIEARAYYRQQDWNMCLSMLAKSLDLVQKQKEEYFMLPELYYSMALAYAHRQEIPIALQYFKLTISTATKKLPDDHPDMQKYRFQLQLYTNDVLKAIFQGQHNN
ncbi:unnamed protein product [Rotaria socialis]|nr:unnamed protein product [Rotaria socialis]CAF3550051.1 unnamed protein product [Rotaria socialis]